MKTKYGLLILLISAFAIGLWGINCTNNAITDDDGGVTGDQVTLSGTVSLIGTDHHGGVFVWLEAFELHTRTDSTGYFEIRLPPPSQQPGGGLNAVLKLYFFMANYQTNTAEVILQNGKIAKNTADFNEDGEMQNPRSLRKIVDIEIETWYVPPDPPNRPFPSLASLMRVTPALPPCDIQFPEQTANWLGAFIMRKTDMVTDDVTYELIAHTDELTTKTLDEVTNFSVQSNLTPNTLAEGYTYRIIPYVLVPHPEIPDELFEALGFQRDEVSLNFFNYPFRYESNEFGYPF